MKKILWKLVLAVLSVFIIINIISWVTASVKTEIAMNGTLEKAYTFDGVIVRDEQLVNSKSAGILETKVAESDLVKKGKLIGSVYYGDMDSQTQKELSAINHRIHEITTSRTDGELYSNDINKIDAAVSSKINDLIVASHTKNLDKVVSFKNDIDALLDKKGTINGEGNTSEAILEDLIGRKQVIESRYNATKEDLYSPSSGRFSTKVDGYEQLLNPASVKSMTVEDWYTIKKTKPEDKRKETDTDSVCKIVNPFEWSVVVLANYELLDEIDIGKQVYIRFENQPDITAYVASVSEQKNGKCLVEVKSSYNSDFAMNTRFTKLELITEKFEGLKIPLEAVRVNSKGEKGVYVAKNNEMKFKKARVLYNDGKYAIISQENDAQNYLLLYDEVIITGGKCYDGKRIDIR